MLSILIPIYNFDVRNFVKELHSQAENESIIFEIILADDASDTNYRELNKELQSLSNTEYIQLNSNIGRSAIRNFLFEKSNCEYLLFADCDSKISNKDFIKKYIEHCKGKVVICGGRTYEEKKPFCSKEFLRWYYGKKRESKTADERNKFPNRSFMTNNYVISKSIHNAVKFDEKISQYGHEDTLFGIELKRKGINIKHINNSLIHIGLEKNTDFISKTKKGIDNLSYLINNYNYTELYEDIKLLRTYKKSLSLSFFIILFFNIIKKIIELNLKSRYPLIKLFDFYKLGYLHTIRKNR